MSGLLMVATTAALTAFFGVVVFVTGQIILKFFVEPIQEQAKIKGEVSNALVFYANVEGGIIKPELREEAQTELRELAARLRASVSQIPYYISTPVQCRMFVRTGANA